MVKGQRMDQPTADHGSPPAGWRCCGKRSVVFRGDHPAGKLGTPTELRHRPHIRRAGRYLVLLAFSQAIGSVIALPPGNDGRGVFFVSFFGSNTDW